MSDENNIEEFEPPITSCYGYFTGGDPRNFTPDYEMCSEAEIANHKRACELWDEAEAKGETPEPEKCPSGWIHSEDGQTSIHVLNAPYGIGVQFYES